MQSFIFSLSYNVTPGEREQEKSRGGYGDIEPGKSKVRKMGSGLKGNNVYIM